MSAWKILLRHLHDQGGGPLRLAKFDKGVSSTPQTCMNYSKSLGLVVDLQDPRRVKTGCIWRLTPLGTAFCEGKAQVVKRTTVEYSP